MRTRWQNLHNFIIYYKTTKERRLYILKLEGKKVGFAMTGSFCTFKNTIPKIKEIVNLGAEVVPIMSFNAYELDTKFGKAQDFIDEIEEITGKKIIHTIPDAEPIRTQENDRYYDYCTMYRKHYCKTCKRNNRHTSYNGCKISFKK